MSLIERYSHLLSQAETAYGVIQYLTTDIPIGASIARYGEWSGIEIALHSHLISKSSTIIDIGTNIGTHTLAYARMAPQGNIIYFEPQTLLFSMTEKTLKLNGLTNAVGFNLAVSSGEKQLFIGIPEYERPGNFGLPQTFRNINEIDRGTEVEAISLDDLQLQSCDFIKIDAEGATLTILQGAQNTIRSFAPHIATEILDIKAGWDLFQWIKSLKMGYSIFYYRFKCFNADNFLKEFRNMFGVAEESGFLISTQGDILKIKIDGLQIFELDGLDTFAREFFRTPRYGDVTAVDRDSEKVSRILIKLLREGGVTQPLFASSSLWRHSQIITSEELDDAFNQAWESELVLREAAVVSRELSLIEREADLTRRLKALVGPYNVNLISPTYSLRNINRRIDGFINETFEDKKCIWRDKLRVFENELKIREDLVQARELLLELQTRHLVAPVWGRPMV